MKLNIFLATTIFALFGTAHAAEENHAHDHEPLHGGIVVEAKDMDYELVAKPDVLQLYVRDHGKPVDVTKASAKATLLSGSEKQEIELKPSEGKLEARGNFNITPDTKIVTQVTINNKPAIARFVFK